MKSNSSSLILPSQFINEAEDHVKNLIISKLVAIYEGNNQIATGFLVRWKNKSVLVTAMHCLYGHEYNEDPLKKGVFIENRLELLEAIIEGKVVYNKEFDITAVYVNGFKDERIFPYSDLRKVTSSPPMVTTVGFLARDFARNKDDSTLRPKPLCHSDKSVEYKTGFVAVQYLNRAVDSQTGDYQLIPIPKGLSGTVMLNTSLLLLNKIEICGVFTDQRLSEGFVFGPHINILDNLLNELYP